MVSPSFLPEISTDKTNGGRIMILMGSIKSGGDNSCCDIELRSSSCFRIICQVSSRLKYGQCMSNEPAPTETSDYEKNLIMQQLISTMSLQAADKSTDTLDKSPGNRPPTSNGNTIDDTSNNGGPGTPPAKNASPATSTNTPTGMATPDMSNTPSSKTLAPNGNPNGGTPSTTTSSSGTNGSPSGSPTYPKGDLTTVPSDNGKTNGVLSYPYTTTTYPTDIPSYFDQGLPNYNPESMSPNTGNGVLNSSPYGTIPTVATSIPNSYVSPSSPPRDSTDKTNGGDYDFNGSIKSGDNSVVSKYRSSSSFNHMQYTADQYSNDSNEPAPTETSDYEKNLIMQQLISTMSLQAADKSTDTLDKSPGNRPPTSNGNTIDDTSNNGGPGTPPAKNASPATSTNTPTGMATPDMSNTPSSKTLAPNGNPNGGTPSTTTSSSGTNGSPSGSPTYPKGDLTTVPSDNGKTNGVLSYPYTTTTYPTDIPSYFDQGLPNYNPESMSPNTGNGVLNSSPYGTIPTVATSIPNSYVSPSSPSRDSTDKTNGGDYDFNGSIKSGDNSVVSKYRSSSSFNHMQYTADQYSNDSNEPAPTETSDYEKNLIMQQLISTMSLQAADKSTDTLDKSPGNRPPTSNGNTIDDTSNNGGPGTPPAKNASPATSTNTPTGMATPDMSNTPSSKTLAPNGNPNGGTPSTTTSSSGTNGSPSGSPTYPKGDLTTVPSDNGKTNGVLSYPYTTTTYPTDIPSYFDQGLPNYNPESMSPNTGNGVLNSSPYGTIPTVATSIPNSYVSPSSPSRDSTDKTNGGDYDFNGSIKSGDNSVVSKYRSSSSFNHMQYTADQYSNDSNEPAPTETSDYEKNLIMQQLISTMSLQAADKSTDTLDKSPGNRPPTSNGNTIDDTSNNGGPGTPPAKNASPATSTNTPTGMATPDMSNTPSSKTLAPNGNPNGGTPSTTTSSSGTNGSPSGSPTYPKGDLTTVPSDNGKTNGVLSYPYTTTTYPTDIPSYFDQGLPNYNPESMSPNTGNGVLNSSPYGTIPTVATSIPNSYGSPTGDEYAFKRYDDFYGVSQTGYETLSDQIPDNYNFGFEYQNDDQINMDDRYIPVNYDTIKYNDGVNTPILNEDEFYNNFYYEKSSINVNNMQSSNGDYDLSNYGSNVDDYYDDNKYDNGNQPEYSYGTYESNVNAVYDNSQMQYGLNQNTPLYRGYSLSDNDNRPYDTDIYAYNGVPMSYNPDVYNYDNRVNIQYGSDQSGIGIDDMNPDTKITPTIDSYSNIDMTSGTSYDSVNGNNKGREIFDSIGQVNENTAYNGQFFNEYIPLGNLPEYNQLNDDYSTTYMSNLQTFETSSSSKTGTNIPDGPYLTPQLINSDYNSLPINNLDKQNLDLNGLLIDSTQLNGYLYGEFDASNVNAQVGLTKDGSNGFSGKTADDLLNPTRNIDLSKNNALDVGQNVYGANGQVIGKIVKPSNDTRKNNNRQKYSGSSSYSSLSDSEFSEDMHAIGHDVKRAARGAVDNIHNKTKDAYDTAKNVGKAVGNAVGNAANNTYQGTKEVAKDVGNAVGNAANAVEQTANNAYQNTKDVANGMEDVASDTADGIKQTAKTAYQGTKDVINGE
ncbi:hypothetical protein AGLY_004946 [Aphis glycines]|uniref:Uncharacterized protein n=1 Tax=Aphis glycines TaxID=307491 RepID=A0A6G0TVQ7_APHGL|nr:hypothetical protein AGLY_004946 [Aphis glycines]